MSTTGMTYSSVQRRHMHGRPVNTPNAQITPKLCLRIWRESRRQLLLHGNLSANKLAILLQSAMSDVKIPSIATLKSILLEANKAGLFAIWPYRSGYIFGLDNDTSQVYSNQTMWRNRLKDDISCCYMFNGLMTCPLSGAESWVALTSGNTMKIKRLNAALEALNSIATRAAELVQNPNDSTAVTSAVNIALDELADYSETQLTFLALPKALKTSQAPRPTAEVHETPRGR